MPEDCRSGVARLAALAIGILLLAPSSAVADSANGDRTFPVGNATLLRLNVSGSVHAIAVRGLHSLQLHIVDSGASAPPIEVTSSHTGSRMNVSIEGPSQSVLPFAGGTGYELEISYPAELRLDLREFAGRVHLDDVPMPAQVYDANGDIVVDRTNAPLTAEADSGDISVSAARSSLELTCGTGNVDAQLSPGWNGKIVRLEASDGNLHLRVPPGFRAHFDLSTGSGTVANSVHGQSGGPLVFALAERGNVSIDRL
jgi:hypothetical protein